MYVAEQLRGKTSVISCGGDDVVVVVPRKISNSQDAM